MAEFSPGWGRYMGPALTPEEMKALSRIQKTGTGVGGLVGEYIPRGSGPAPAGLLGADPVVDYKQTKGAYEPKPGSIANRPALEGPTVSTQQQSGYRAPKPEKVIYVNSAGQAGSSVPKGSGLSGVYETGGEAAAKSAGRGLLSQLGRWAAGPVGVGVQAAVTPGNLENPNEDPQWKEHYRQEPGWQYAQGIADRAVNAGAQYAQNMMKPQNSVTVPEQPAPEESPLAANQKMVETRANDMLSKGTLSRKAAAEAVVAADEIKTGEPLSEKVKEERVKEEAKAMRSMEQGDLAKYIGWALAGVGLVASAVDESGDAARNYGNAFQSEVERKRNIKAMQAKMEYEAAEKAKDREIKQQNADTQRMDVESKVGSREEASTINQAKLELAQVAEARKAAGQDARLSLEQQKLSQKAANDAVRLGLLAEKNKILAEKAAKASGPKGLNLSTKDATTQVKEYAKSQGVEIDDATAQAAGSQLQYLAKNNPTALALDPSAALETIMKKYRTTTPETFGGIFGGNKAYALPGLMKSQ